MVGGKCSKLISITNKSWIRWLLIHKTSLLILKTMNQEIEQIAMKEFYLNIKHQLGKIKEVTTIGYEFEKGYYLFMILFPFKFKEMFRK